MTDHQHTADTLNRAADLIERDGWTQGVYGDSSGRCAMGAIHAVVETGDRPVRDGSIAGMAVATYLGGSVAFWNDRPGRTAAEVIEVLRATAVIEQARADEHTATDTGYDTAAEMLSVAGDAAARTLAALR